LGIDMKIAVIGAGAIGGLVGAKLALAGEDVTFIVRGANLDAIATNGFKLIGADGTEQVARNVKATDSYDQAGPQDIVVLAMKAHQVEAVANDVPKLFGPETVVVTMQNGIPYWYFHNHGGALAGTPVRSVDPTGLVAAKIPAERVIGCVVYPASELIAPGVVKHIEGDRFPVGELDGSSSERVNRVSACLHRGRLQGAGAGQHPRRNLAQALGQPDLQPDQQPLAFDAGRHLPVPAIARLAASMMRRSAGRGAQAGHRVPRDAGQAHRRRREGRQAQDLDAAGRRSRARAGDRRAGGRRGRTGAAHRHPDAAHRHRVPWSSCWRVRWKNSVAGFAFTRWRASATRAGRFCAACVRCAQ
jgi:hypothetical protein